MSFTPKAWEDYPAATTTITAAALVDMEERLSNYAGHGNRMTGYEPFPRNGWTSTGNSLGAGVVRFMYFTAVEEVPCTAFYTASGTTAAAATPSLCRVGLYSVGVSGDLDLVARSANDPTLWAATITAYTSVMATAGGYPSSVTPVIGQRYALAVVCVTGGTPPTMYSQEFVRGTHQLEPRMTAALVGQTDLPTHVPSGDLLPSDVCWWVGLVP